MSYELKQYSFGETIGKGFNLYFENFIPIVLASLVCQIPMFFFTYYFMTQVATLMLNASRFNLVMVWFFSMLLGLIMQAILSAFIISTVSKKMLQDGLYATVNRSTSIMPLILPVIGLSILVGLLTLLSTIALIIPGIIVALGLSLATEVMVIEKRGITQSISRSWNLTNGKKMNILGMMIVSGLILVGISLPFTIAFSLMNLEPQITQYLQLIISGMISPLQACMIVVVYFNLRIEKEGFNIEHLVQQFSISEDPGTPVEM